MDGFTDNLPPDIGELGEENEINIDPSLTVTRDKNRTQLIDIN